VNLYEKRGWTRLLRALRVGLERRAEMTAAGVRESPSPVPRATPERQPAHAEGTTPQTAPARVSTGVDSEVLGQLELMRSSRLGSRERVAAGNALAQYGDPRFRADAWYLPDEPLLGFVEIPAGPFLMGSIKVHDQDASDNELPQHEVVLPRYFIGRYPVTVGQFRAFVEASGHRPEGEDHLHGPLNHPAVGVTWYEALQYCHWLTERLRAWEAAPALLASLLRQQGWEVTLPSETEWEKAARGSDGRIYPWGNAPDPNRANYDATGIYTTNAVGCFPDGASPYGVEELSGNVWEWTRSLYEDYPYPTDKKALAEREDLQASKNQARVLRGGAFFNLHGYVRCASRGGDLPDFRYELSGCRVVVRPSF